VRVAVIVNPAAGPIPNLDHGRRRATRAAAVLREQGVDAEVMLTERPGHACDLARAAAASGADIIVAWGGDGTINEIGCALAFTGTPMAIVRGGSGNGLAYALGVPRDPAAALRQAVTAPPRRIDVGEIGGRLFFNIAGIGFDAHVADRFGREGRNRGLRGYASVVARELFTYRAMPCRLTIEGCEYERRAFLLTVANGPQWGNGARVAPNARLDDGLLDLVTVEPRSPLAAAWQIRRLFTGTFGEVRGVTTERVSAVEIDAPPPVIFHVDGQPASSDESPLKVRVHPGALYVRA
jgi:diacylglycerol kinase (ATP)